MLWHHDMLSMPSVQKQEQLTPEQLKAVKGPSPEDPVEAEGAASWVQQFNEELAAPSRNALEREQHPTSPVRCDYVSWCPMGRSAEESALLF